jgi:hypothetical protein
VSDDVYRAALNAAIGEYRELVVELAEKEQRFNRLRFAILSLANGLDVEAPDDVLRTLPKTRKDVQRAVQRAKELNARASRVAV